ncbi:hypothetical protein EV361DRAFT_951036 [Lentinula raphanica]|nr:hypothetical protein F5880DRAFT_1617985 [Lentinula raphanica]KAJ3969924.1 hypothetical protein EV361DRAFT_951036 [Lentinula raphanica]
MTEFALPQTSGDPQAPDQNPAGSTTQNSPDPLVSKTPPHPFPQSKSLNASNRTHRTRADPEKYARLKQMSVEARLEYNLGVQRRNDACYAKSLGNEETSDSESIVSVDEREFQQIRRSWDSFNTVKAKLSQYSISWLMDRNLKEGIPNWTLEDGLPALPRRPRSPSDDDSVALNAKRSKPSDVDFEPVEEMLSDDEGDPSGICFPSKLKLHARNKIPIPFHFFTTKNVKFLLSSHMTFDRVKLPNGSQAFSLKDAQKQIARSTDTDVKDVESLPWHLWEEAFLNLMFFHSSRFEAGSNAPLILELKGLADFFRNKEDSHKYYPYWKEEEDPGREEG